MNEVEHPTHYNIGKIEVWDFIEDQTLDFLDGNVIKYICRAGKKTADSLVDYKKALEYLKKKISVLEKKGILSGNKN